MQSYKQDLNIQRIKKPHLVFVEKERNAFHVLKSVFLKVLDFPHLYSYQCNTIHVGIECTKAGLF